MHALQKFEVDVHVERHLAATLQLLLLDGAFVEARLRDALRQQLAHAPAQIELTETRLCLGEQPEAEGGQAQLRHGAVEEDLGRDVHVRHVLLQVRHEHQVAPLAEVAAKRLVKDVAKHGARLAALVAVLVDEERQALKHGAESGRRVLEAHGVRNLGRLLGLRLVGVLVVQILVAFLLSRLHALALVLRLFIRRRLGRHSVGSPARGELVRLLQLGGGKLAQRLVHGLGFVVKVLQQAQRELAGGGGGVAAVIVLDNLVAQDDEQRLVLHAIHVLLGVRVDGLHGLEVLVVEALAEGAQRPPQLHGRAGEDFVGGGACLGLLILRQRDVRVLLQQLGDAQKVVDALLPYGDGHVRGHGAGDVELRGNEQHQHLNFLCRALGHGGDVRQVLYVLVAVGALLATAGHDVLELLFHHVVRDRLLGRLHDVQLHLGRLALLAHDLEAGVVTLLLRRLGLLLVLGGFLRLLGVVVTVVPAVVIAAV
mmetsp:Transcript_20025/g.49793  ORF Transcript_20025/g.49793 Transcript_20025/m.49793 type:complete len:482 (-) Transcript_20025:673-2118(-)